VNENEQRSPTLLHSNKRKIVQGLNRLIATWEAWSKDVDKIVDQPYDHNRQSEVFADGEGMMQKHEILQEKTLTFLNGNIRGHGFVTGFNGDHCDRTDLRLKHRVKHRLHELRILRGCLQEINDDGTEADLRFVVDSVWKAIQNDYDVSKVGFGRKISFVTDTFKRNVIFRDVAQAYVLANAGFPKPAVILAGSVIEELLRLFLEHKGIRPSAETFEHYLKACAEKGLLKSAIIG
jgi:hypothetical protein